MLDGPKDPPAHRLVPHWRVAGSGAPRGIALAEETTTEYGVYLDAPFDTPVHVGPRGETNGPQLFPPRLGFRDKDLLFPLQRSSGAEGGVRATDSSFRDASTGYILWLFYYIQTLCGYLRM